MELQRDAGEPWNSLSTIIQLIFDGRATTKSAVEKWTGLGRATVAERVSDLLAHKLVVEGEFEDSKGGRRPRALRVNRIAGRFLVAGFGGHSLSVGLAYVDGTIESFRRLPFDVAEGPEASLERVRIEFERLLQASELDLPVWGIGLGLPGPVEFETGKPVAPPTMPGWDEFPVREKFAQWTPAPVWVDNDVNLLALGEYAGGAAAGEQDFIYVKVGAGIGAGLVTRGMVYRGAHGSAGDIGHIVIDPFSALRCRCGKLGCLEVIGGGRAIERDATIAAEGGKSPALAKVLESHPIQVEDVIEAAGKGDTAALDLLHFAGMHIGRTVAGIVSILNPRVLLIGGQVAAAGEMLLPAIRQAVQERSPALATRDLRISRAGLSPDVLLHGAAILVRQELFSPRALAGWWLDSMPSNSVPNLTYSQLM